MSIGSRCRYILSMALLGGSLFITNHTTASEDTGKSSLPTAFVSIKQDNAVEVFPDRSTWEGGPTMLYDALTPDGKMLLVTSPGTGSVYAFDTSSGEQLAIIKTGKAAKGVKINPAGNEAYVSNEGEASISIVNLESLKVVGTIQTEDMPHNVRFSADGKTAYVTLQGGAGLGVIDTQARKVIRVIPVPGLTGPHNLDLSRDGEMAFVRDTVNHVAVVDLDTGEVKKLIEVGIGHAGIDVTPDGRYAFTGAIGDKVVSVIDVDTLSLVKQIEVGNGPHGVRASSDSRWIYITVTAANKVVVIDSETLEIAKEFSVGKFPFWVAVQGNQ